MNSRVNDVLNKTRIYVAVMKNNINLHPHLRKCKIEKHIKYALDEVIRSSEPDDIIRYLVGLYYICRHLQVGEVKITGNCVTTRSKHKMMDNTTTKWICVNIDIRNIVNNRILYQYVSTFNILLHLLICYKMPTRSLRKCALNRNVVCEVSRHYNSDYSGYVIRLPIAFKRYLFAYLYNGLKVNISMIKPDDAIFITNNFYDYVKPSKEHVRILIEDMYRKDDANYSLEFVLTNLNKWEHLKERCNNMLYKDLTAHKNIYHALNINVTVTPRLYYEFINVDVETYYAYISTTFPINIAYYLECIAFFKFANNIRFYEYFYIIHKYLERYIKDCAIDLEWQYYVTHEQCAYNLIIKLAQYFNIYVAVGNEYQPMKLTYAYSNLTEEQDSV